MGKVLIYILTEGKGGVEEYVMNLSRFCDNPSSKYGYLVMGDKTIYEEELNSLGVEYYYIPRKSKVISNIKAYSELLKRLRTDYDTIYFNTSGLYYAIPYIYACKFNYRIVLHSHSTTGSSFKKPIHYFNRKWINKACSTRLACSTPAGKWMFGAHEQFTLIPNAIELDKFKFDEGNRERCREKYDLGDSFVMGNIGRLHRVKNQIFLVDILKEMIDRGINTKLLLVGDGEEKQSIESRANELRIREEIVFAGQSSAPELFYSAMDCFVMPSFVEGFPITLIEAQANGLPCVVSDAITRETNVTGNVLYESIKKNAISWAEKIPKCNKRYNCTEVLRRQGYDVLISAQNIEKILFKQSKTRGCY